MPAAGDLPYRAVATLAVDLVGTKVADYDIVAAEAGWQAYSLAAAPGTFPHRGPYLGEVLRTMHDIRAGKRKRLPYSPTTWKRALKLLNAAEK